jgi:glycosyltransferase involved in cell wall biosynthesis
MALSVKEAMAMELPVIATDCVANPEMVDERCGVLVPEADAPALADAIARFAAMPEEQLRRMGEAGRRRVVEDFSLAGQTALLAQEFRRLGVVPVSAEVHGSSLLRSLEPAG